MSGRIDFSKSSRTLAQRRHDLVGEAWRRIWEHAELDKAYLADYERYRPDGTIEICIGLNG